MSEDTTVERVAREGRYKEIGAEARMEGGVSHADISPTLLRPHLSH